MPREKGRTVTLPASLPTVLAIVRGPLGTLQLLGGAVWVEAKWCLALMGFRSISCVFLCQWSQWRRRWTSKAQGIWELVRELVGTCIKPARFNTSPFFLGCSIWMMGIQPAIFNRDGCIILRLQDSYRSNVLNSTICKNPCLEQLTPLPRRLWTLMEKKKIARSYGSFWIVG